MKPYCIIRDNNDALDNIARKTKQGYKVPLLIRNISELQELGYEVESPVKKSVNTNHPTYGKLYTYQKDAVEFLVSSPLPGSILNLSPGLGKGITSIVATELLEPTQVLIVCSKTLVDMWISELKKWSKDGEDVNYAVWHSDYNKSFDEAKYIITTIETFTGRIVNGSYKRHEGFKRVWPIIIYDESLNFKSRNSNRYKALAITKFRKIFLLSGNPISRYYDDLWTQLNIIWPEAFSSYWRFAKEYCYVESNVWADTVTGNRRANPANVYKDLIITKNQSIELPDLPDFIYRQRNIDLHPYQRQKLNLLLDDMILRLDNGEEVQYNSDMLCYGRLMQITSCASNIDGMEYSSAKHDAIIEMIESNDVEYPLLIWVFFVNGANALAKRLTKLGLRVGVAVRGSKQPIQDYIDGKLDILLLSIPMGKHGLTLTNTKHMIHLDMTFGSDDYYQSFLRVKRIGLKHTPVYTRLFCKNSSDTIVEDVLRGKLPGIAKLNNEDVKNILKGLRQ